MICSQVTIRYQLWYDLDMGCYDLSIWKLLWEEILTSFVRKQCPLEKNNTFSTKNTSLDKQKGNNFVRCVFNCNNRLPQFPVVFSESGQSFVAFWQSSRKNSFFFSSHSTNEKEVFFFPSQFNVLPAAWFKKINKCCMLQEKRWTEVVEN